jgi:phospholipid/cholesterol/gamma-HCH transport system substrate-binding protein
VKRSDTLRWSQVKLGLVLLASFLILLWVAFNSDVLGVFRREDPLAARFPSADGLLPGAPVVFLGMEVGRVGAVDLDPRDDRLPVRVAFEVREEVRRSLRADASVRIGSIGILGDKLLELEAGDAAAPLPKGAVLRGAARTELVDLIEPGRRTLNKLDAVVQNLEAISLGLEEGRGTVGRLLRDDELHESLAATLAETRGALADLRRTQDDVGARVASAAASVDSLATTFRAGEGTLNRLADDPSLYENLNDASIRLERVLTRLEESEGLAGRFVSDPVLADEFTGLVVDLRALLQDMRENPNRYVQFSVF